MTRKKVAVAGATGLVGRKMLEVLEERRFPIESLKLFASRRSAGMLIPFRGEKLVVEELTENSFEGLDIALFSAGGKTARHFAPLAASAGCVAIDNSSAWRRERPLVVPEVNPEDIDPREGIIANPNCSTIQLVVALKPILDTFGLRRVCVSTYQSITGAGQKGLDKLRKELDGEPTEDKHPIAFNAIFHPISELEPDMTVEESKMHYEIRKILHAPKLPLNVTCVRLPILGGHGESVNFQTVRATTPDAVREVLRHSPGIKVIDDLALEAYPTPQMASDTDDVYVGRIRRDSSLENGFNLWCVSDNVRKGAATNAVQIAELL